MNRPHLRRAVKRDRAIYLKHSHNPLDVDLKSWARLPTSPNKPNTLTEETMRRTDAGDDLNDAKDFDDLVGQLNE